eukprot:1180007-Prymnesium_polylepis.2
MASRRRSVWEATPKRGISFDRARGGVSVHAPTQTCTGAAADRHRGRTRGASAQCTRTCFT